jgi:hypothetical protein
MNKTIAIPILGWTEDQVAEFCAYVADVSDDYGVLDYQIVKTVDHYLEIEIDAENSVIKQILDGNYD